MKKRQLIIVEKIENIIDFQMFEDTKVLIVDEDENTVELLSSMIESEGFELSKLTARGNACKSFSQSRSLIS